MIKYLFLLLFLVPIVCFAYPKTPNINIAPGHLCSTTDKDFSYYRYDERVPYCERNVSNSRKQKIYDKYNIPQDDRGKLYTIDHIIPLSLGGSNNDTNLWPQSKKIYTGHLEYWLYKQLRDGKMRQVEVVHFILSHKYNPVGKDHVPYPPQD